MISVTDLRAGTTYEEDGQSLLVLSYEHIKMGRGSANIKVKVRNIKSGTIVEKSYINGAKVQPIQVTKKDMQFLYKDDDSITSWIQQHMTKSQSVKNLFQNICISKTVKRLTSVF